MISVLWTKRIEVTGRRGRRRRKLLDDLKERRGYSHLKEEALDRTVWRARFGRGFGPVVRQISIWNEWTITHAIQHNALPVNECVIFSLNAITIYYIFRPLSGPLSGKNHLQEIYKTLMHIVTRFCSSRLHKIYSKNLNIYIEGKGHPITGHESPEGNLIFVFPCIIICGFIRTSLMQIV